MATTAQPDTADFQPDRTDVAKGWGTDAPDQPLRPMEFERRALRPDDVAIKITYAGICHSDLHTCRNDWGGTRYPVIPGHEIVGTVTGDRRRGHPPPRRRHGRGRLHGRQLHGVRPVPRRLGSLLPQGLRPDLQQPRLSRRHASPRAATPTISSSATISCCKVPDGMDVSRVAPLLCAGITTYSPLRQYKVGPGTKMAVVGLGGLGHMGVKLGAAMGAHVTMITTTPSKGEDARALGAHDVIISTDAEQMKAAATRFDFILNTIPGQP